MTGLPAALVAALLLGLRHATDPDHLTAVSILALDEDAPVRRAARLGASWGLGHAVTLLLVGLPVVLAGSLLPDAVRRGAESLVGVIIAALAARLLLRWRRGAFHAHAHVHDGVLHAHAHVNDARHAGHHHPHRRSDRAAFCVGLVHGIGGSAGTTLLLVAGRPDPLGAAALLAVFASGTAISMALVSAGFGWAARTGRASRWFERAIPVFGCGSLAFGVWYVLAAILSPGA
jgi:cytochrome c biogenesis protein CcdA